MFKKDGKVISASSETTLRFRALGNEFSKSRIWVERDNFYGHSKFDPNKAYIIIGFDTEFKTPDKPVNLETLKAGDAKYTVLSYQVHCAVYDPAQPDASEWSAICYPESGVRIKLADLLTMAFFKGLNTGCVHTIPTRVYVVGHFTRADLPAFADFKDISEQIGAVRSTFSSLDDHISVNYEWSDHGCTSLMVILRDTMLLTPATSKSLSELGSLVGVEKLTVDPDAEKALHYKKNMDQLLADKPEVFEKYAINDAIICVRYLDRLITMYFEIFGKRVAPATLSAIGVDLLIKRWAEVKISKHDAVGKEEITERIFDKKRANYRTKKVVVEIDTVHIHLALATECYHGGRGEQFWFGPAFED